MSFTDNPSSTARCSPRYISCKTSYLNLYVLNNKENKALYTVFIVSSCCGLQAIKDLKRKACVPEINELRDDHMGMESCPLYDVRGQFNSDEGDVKKKERFTKRFHQQTFSSAQL